MERCLEIFLIMRYLHVRSQEHERGGLNRFANALQYALCLESPSEGGRKESGGSTCSGQVNGPQKRRNKSAQNGAKMTEGEEESKGKRGREIRYVNFVCWQQTPKLSWPKKQTHTRTQLTFLWLTITKQQQKQNRINRRRGGRRERRRKKIRMRRMRTELKRNLRSVFRIQYQQTKRQLKETCCLHG